MAAALAGAALAGAAGAAPLPRAGGGTLSAADGGGGLNLTPLDWFVWPNHEPANSHLMVWVNVTNPGTDPATGLTGQMRGADLAFVGEAYGPATSGTLSPGGSAQWSFSVLPREAASVSAQISSSSRLGAISLSVVSSTGQSFPGTSNGNSASVSLSEADTDAGAFGPWTATVTQTGGLRGVSYTMGVWYDFVTTDANLSIPALPAGATYQAYFNIWADEPYPTLPPALEIFVNATVNSSGGPRQVSYIARPDAPIKDTTATEPAAEAGLPAGVLIAVVAVVALAGAGLVAFRIRGRLRPP